MTEKHELAGTLRGLVLKFLTIAAIFTVTPLRATDIGGWTLGSAPLAINAASGRELSGGIHVLRIPDCGGCGWWTTSAAIKPSGGVHFRAQAEIVPDNADEKVYNDLMMFVRWEFPKDGKDRSASGNGVDKGEFYQRDFIAYTDRVESGCVIRSFDQVFAAPGECDRVTIEFIGKWHAMTVKISELEVENVPRPTPRKVRCVVGNPHESTFAHEINDTNVFQVRLGQIEATLTNIFAHVENPDIILFSECFSGAGAKNPANVAEPVPGGPSWNLAAKYAMRYRCNIAMDVKERDEEGRCHNTVFVCDRQGRLAGRYRKVHLTSGEYRQGLVPGKGFPVFDLDFGRVGVLICWDNWFSESIKLVKRNGAELLLFPLAGCLDDHTDLCFPARAIDAGIPIMVAMRQGHLPSGIIDRDGKWVAKTFEDNGFAVADIDLAERKRVFWLSVGPGKGDPYQLYYDESRPEIYENYRYR